MSFRPCVRCQHFQNPKAPRPLGRRRRYLARIFCESEGTTSRKRNFEFRPLRRVEPPRTYPGRERWPIPNVDGYGSHSFTCKLHYTWLYPVSVHQTAPPLTCDAVYLLAAYYSFIDPERMKGGIGLTYNNDVPNVTAHALTACIRVSYYLMWQYNWL